MPPSVEDDDDIPIVVRRRQNAKPAIAPESDSDSPIAPAPKASPVEKKSKSNNAQPNAAAKAAPKATAKRKTVTSKPANPARRKKLEEENSDDGGGDPVGEFKKGQRHVTPCKGDGTRAFYESLLKEKPLSLIGNKWCIEHGVLIGTQHKSQYARYVKLRLCGGLRGTQGGLKPEFMTEDLPDTSTDFSKSSAAKTVKKSGTAPNGRGVKAEASDNSSPAKRRRKGEAV